MARSSSARHLDSALVVVAMMVGLIGLWAGRAPEPRCEPELELIRTQIELLRIELEIQELDRRLDDAIKNLEVADDRAVTAESRERSAIRSTSRCASNSSGCVWAGVGRKIAAISSQRPCLRRHAGSTV